MKKLLYFSFVMLIISLLVDCKGKKTDSGANLSSDSTAVYAVCVWDKVSLKDSPSDQGKWLASLSLGEKCIYLDDQQEDKKAKKTSIYYKVQLQDKKEGWVQSDFVILNSKPAALVRDAEIYSRPDLLTKTNKTYGTMDIVAIKSEQSDFIEVVGKRKDGKWIETGWIKSSNVTNSDIDIAVAKFGSKALTISDRQKRNAAINEIVKNSDFKSSVFINTLYTMIDDSVSTDKSVKEDVKAEGE